MNDPARAAHAMARGHALVHAIEPLGIIEPAKTLGRTLAQSVLPV